LIWFVLYLLIGAIASIIEMRATYTSPIISFAAFLIWPLTLFMTLWSKLHDWVNNL
jgi:hypothetical protein